MSLLGSRSTRLFVCLTAFFVGNAVVAEFVGVKIFALETTFGLPPLGWNLFGQEGSLNFTAGVLIWPIVFILTDVINEYFGPRGVRLISSSAMAMISYGFVFAYASIHLRPGLVVDHGQCGSRGARHAGAPMTASSGRACGRSAGRSPRSSSAS